MMARRNFAASGAAASPLAASGLDSAQPGKLLIKNFLRIVRNGECELRQIYEAAQRQCA